MTNKIELTVWPYKTQDDMRSFTAECDVTLKTPTRDSLVFFAQSFAIGYLTGGNYYACHVYIIEPKFPPTNVDREFIGTVTNPKGGR